MVILSKEIYILNATPIKLHVIFSQNYYRTNNPEIYMEQQKINSCQSHCEEKNKAGGITLLALANTTKLQ